MTALFLIVFVSTLAISLLATWRVKRSYLRYSDVPASSGLNGAEVAARILERAGITDVEIAEHDEMLGDHYDPMHKRLPRHLLRRARRERA
jgi:Zn-dependent membrane protease YugP